MKQLRLILVIILSVCWIGSWAKGKQTITINGLTIGKSAKKITFSGEKAMIVYADGSKQTENMGLIQLSFTYSTNGGIKTLGYTISMDNMSGQRSMVYQKAFTSSMGKKWL